MENIDLKLIQSDQTVDPKVLEVYEHLKDFKAAPERIAWLERYNSNWEVIENKIWTDDEEKEMRKEKQIPFSINKVVKGVQGTCAVQTNNKPGLKFKPIGNGDLYTAELIQRGFNIVWEKNEGHQEVYEFVEEREVGALAFLNVTLDKSRSPFGSIVFENDLPEDIYFSRDSRKRDFSDTHIIKAKMRNLEYIKENYPDIKEDDLYFLPISKDDADKSSGVEGEDNYTIDTATPDSIPAEIKSKQKIIWEIEAWLLKTVKEDWAAEIGENGEPKTSRLELKDNQKPEDVIGDGQVHWPRKAKKRVRRIIVGKKLISEKTNPFGEDADGDPAISLIGMKAQRTRSAYPMSDTDYARDLNKEKNKRRIQIIHAASQQIGSPTWSTDDVTWDGRPGTPGSHATISKNAGPNAIGRLPAGNANLAILVDLETRSDVEIDDAYDMQDVMKGKIPKGSEDMSGRLGLALQDAVGVMSGPKVGRMESALVRMAKVIVSLMLRHWPRYQWERLLEDEERLNFAPDASEEAKALTEMEQAKGEQEGNPMMGMGGQQQEEEDPEEDLKNQIATKWEEALELIRPKDPEQDPGLSLIDVDVKITAGSSMPTNRIAKAQLGLQKVELGVWDAEAFLEYDDDPMRDKITARLKKKEEAAAQAAAMKNFK